MSGRTTLLVPVPEAEPVVGDLRARFEPSASHGIPAHVTVLFPFLDAAQIHENVELALHDLFAAQPSFAYRFASVGRFIATAYLVPEPDTAFVRMTEAVVAKWPDHPPFEGVFDEVVPHLSAVDKVAPADVEAFSAELERRLASSGPITGLAHEVWLMREDAAGNWSAIARFALGAAT
jgi:hypothetical protein